MPKKSALDTVFVLQVALGLFFLVLGILSFIEYGSAGSELKRTFGESQVIEVLVSVAFLICGLIMLSAIFIPVKTSTLQIAVLVVFVLWLILLVVNNFVLVDWSRMNVIKAKTDIAERRALGAILEWIRGFSMDLVMLCSIWVVRVRRYL